MRNCFLPPIPEIEIAIDLLESASEALLAGERETTAKLIVAADFPQISEFYKRIAGKTDPRIHLQSRQPKSIPKNLRITNRMPSLSRQREVFVRDGWRCRFCGTRVISRPARSIFRKYFPNEVHWVAAEYKRHSALHAQAASLDHILPYSRGGTDDASNFVTACGPCQFGRNQWTLEEVGFSDPRERPPIVDEWDGLERLLALECRI